MVAFASAAAAASPPRSDKCECMCVSFLRICIMQFQVALGGAEARFPYSIGQPHARAYHALHARRVDFVPFTLAVHTQKEMEIIVAL